MAGATKKRAVSPARRLAPVAPVAGAESGSADGASTSLTGGTPSEPMRQAYRDLERGLQDTDRGAEAGRAYRKLKR